MTRTPATPNGEIDARFAWPSLRASAGAADALSDQVSNLVANVSLLAAGIDDADAAGSIRATPVRVRTDIARELSAAAARLVHAATALQVIASEVVDTEAVALDDHERSTRRWLARHNGISVGQASMLCRTASARRRFGRVAEAFDGGELTAGHLDAIANIIPARFHGERLAAAVEAVADIQDTLVDLATNHSVEQFARFCERVRKRLDPDGTPDRAAEPSRVWLTQTVHGRWQLKGDLTADDGAVLATILLDRMARNRRSDPTAAEPDSAADATPEASSSDDTPPRPCESEQRARALAELALDGSAATATGRVGLFLHIDLDHLGLGERPSLAEALTDESAPHTEAALDISVDTLWSLLAGADVTPVFRQTGRTLSYGRTRRLPPPILRRILAHRDRRCRVPGCDRPAIVNQAHHVIHWDDDGPTDPRTCCGACAFHHHDHHDRGLGIEGDAEGTLTFTNGDGSPFTADPAYCRRDDEPDGRDVAA